MTDLSDVRNWLFKGLSVEDLLNRLEGEGIAVKPSTDPGAVQRALSLEGFSSEIRQSAMQAFPAFLAFFCLENAIRELVVERLKENHGPDWWAKCSTTSMQNKIQERQSKEGKHRWHVRRGETEIFYTDFGDLKDLIIKNWGDFEDLLPDQHWLSARLDELEASRNVIAHSNLLEQRELDRIGMYLEDWIRQVG
ncbi:MAG: Swt1 family HEPN domain-containing protein [bacterium]|nr:Swt1 family HEPN domain-containing protein [bacterium]